MSDAAAKIAFKAVSEAFAEHAAEARALLAEDTERTRAKEEALAEARESDQRRKEVEEELRLAQETIRLVKSALETERRERARENEERMKMMSELSGLRASVERLEEVEKKEQKVEIVREKAEDSAEVLAIGTAVKELKADLKTAIKSMTVRKREPFTIEFDIVRDSADLARSLKARVN